MRMASIRLGRAICIGVTALTLWGAIIAAVFARDTWSTTSDRPYDLVANCLAFQMGHLYFADPGVSAPPRREARVQLWPRPYQPGAEPVATFRIVALPVPGGGIGIAFEAPGRFPHFQQAKESGLWCARFAI